MIPAHPPIYLIPSFSEISMQQVCAITRTPPEGGIPRSPFNRLPVEIKSIIFTFCRDLDPPMITPGPHTLGATLSTVCFDWRRVALTTSALWRGIRLDFRIGSYEEHQCMMAMARRWVKRCWKVSISICLPKEYKSKQSATYRRRTPRQPRRLVADPMWEVIIPCSERIGSLELSLSEGAWRAWWKGFYTPFPRLESVIIRDIEDVFEGHETNICPPGLLLPPSLRRFKVISSTLHRNLDSVHQVLFPIHVWGMNWHELTTLNLSEVWVNKMKWIETLRHCSKLIECDLRLESDGYIHDIPAPVTLYTLRVLRLRIERNHDPAGIHPYAFFASLNLPALVEFNLRDHDGIAWQSATMVSFFSRFASRLEALSLSRTSASAEELIRLLHPAISLPRICAPRTTERHGCFVARTQQRASASVSGTHLVFSDKCRTFGRLGLFARHANYRPRNEKNKSISR
ncbi:hypothetical protein B0H10DRAFT_524472 [Mycena sp. CBHHK59/15]|nr:hypothetical protein B0H10DRAFT_524472 [Mycena sp. CBHHK59/15]